ncbi:MAG TPA: hypothetical protein VD994_17165 [Prosthecobacter sp.]|nr:hypothetical protein [Prosthecobacter sp.]
MEAIQINCFAQLAPNPGTDFEWLFYWASCAIALAIGWGIGVVKSASEITKLKKESEKLEVERDKLLAENDKLQSEDIKLAGDFLTGLEACIRNHSQGCVTCRQHVKKIYNMLQGNNCAQHALLAERDAFCHSLTHTVLEEFSFIVTRQCLRNKHNPDRQANYVLKEVIPELNRLSEWVSIINMPLFLEGNSLAPLVISEQTIEPIRSACLDIVDTHRNLIQVPLGDAIALLCSSQTGMSS